MIICIQPVKNQIHQILKVKNEIVLVLHSSFELKIRELQDRLIDCIQKVEIQGKVFRKFPVWCRFQDFYEEPSVFSKQIISVELEKPFYKAFSIILPVKICVKSENKMEKLIRGEIPLLLLTSNISESVLEVFSDFKLNCRIFRVANACFDGSSYWLTDSVWRKLEK